MKKYLVWFIIVSSLFSGYSKNQKKQARKEVKQEVKQEIKDDRKSKKQSNFYMPREGIKITASKKEITILNKDVNTKPRLEKKDINPKPRVEKQSTLASQVKDLLSSKAELVKENKKLRKQLDNMKFYGNVKIYCRLIGLEDIDTIELNYQGNGEFKKRITLYNGDVKEQTVKAFRIKTSCEYEKRHY